MSLFKRKSKKQQVQPQVPTYDIRYSVSPPLSYELNYSERVFLDALFAQLKWSNLTAPTYMYRMADGALSVYYDSYPIGKIRLQKKKHWMQVLTVQRGRYDSYSVDGSIEDFLPHVSKWVEYAKKVSSD